MSRLISCLSAIAILFISVFARAAVPVMAAKTSTNQLAALDAESLSLFGQIGGATTAVTAQAGKLYFNIGPRVTSMNAATPSAPTLPAAYSDLLPGIPEDIAVANGYLYLAMGENGVAIVAADTLALKAAVKLPNNATAYAVAVGAQRLYVAAGDAGIVSYDLGAAKNTLTDQNSKTTVPASSIKDVAVVTTGPSVYLYAGGVTKGLVRYDITSSALPIDGNAITGPVANIYTIYVTPTSVFAATDNGLSVYNPTTLALLGSKAIAIGLMDLAFVADTDTLYATNSVGQVEVLDVSTPATPVHLNAGSPFSPAISTSGIAAIATATETFVYSADFELGLEISSTLNTSPDNLTVIEPSYVQSELAVVDTVGNASAQAFAFANYNHLATVDTTDPSMPTVVGAGISPVDSIYAFTTEQNMLLAAAGSAGLLRYNMVPGGEPTPDGELDTNGYALDVAVVWPNALVADGDNGLQVININGVMDVVAVSPIIDDSSFDLVDAQAALAVVYDSMVANGTLRIYDLTDLSDDLIARGTLEVTGVLDLLISGDYVFLACGEEGVKVMSIANPDAPVLVGSGFNTPGFAVGLANLNSSLYVADYEAGVHLLAIQPDGSLMLKATAETAGNALDLSLSGSDSLYVADDMGGLVIMQSLVAAPDNFAIYLPFLKKGTQ